MYVQLYTFNGSGSLTGPTDAGNFIINERSDHIYSTPAQDSRLVNRRGLPIGSSGLGSHTHTCIYAHTHTHIHIHTHMHTHTHTLSNKREHIHTHTHTQTNTNTYKYTHIVDDLTADSKNASLNFDLTENTNPSALAAAQDLRHLTDGSLRQVVPDIHLYTHVLFNNRLVLTAS